jgi:hypothetical protein
MDYELVIFAGGYKYPNIDAEMKALKAHPPKKLAATNDMIPLATRSGNASYAVNSGIELVGALHEIFDRDDSRLKRLGFLCHGGGGNMYFAGRFPEEGGAVGPPEARVGAPWIDQVLRPHVATFKNKILPDAKVTVYACNSGLAEPLQVSPLLRALANAFGVIVYGFEHPLEVCVNLTPKGKAITTRGFIKVAHQQRKHGVGEGGCEAKGFSPTLSALQVQAWAHPDD